jgi:hypothetical protein
MNISDVPAALANHGPVQVWNLDGNNPTHAGTFRCLEDAYKMRLELKQCFAESELHIIVNDTTYAVRLK